MRDKPKEPDVATLIRTAVLCPAVGTAIDERRDEVRDLGWSLQARQMGHAGQHMARPVIAI